MALFNGKRKKRADNLMEEAVIFDQRIGGFETASKHKFQSVGKRDTPSWSVLPELGFKCVRPKVFVS
ncbi:MAG: hypothetical protein BMS9Abin03_516 [Thermodesulfobacteriota bacterium]|nr:MAG: hypothetical protein BMS9Abin03_516 [Thermodesulfobacteriota bacterium]